MIIAYCMHSTEIHIKRLDRLLHLLFLYCIKANWNRIDIKFITIHCKKVLYTKNIKLHKN